jgi:hypothetical protein
MKCVLTGECNVHVVMSSRKRCGKWSSSHEIMCIVTKLYMFILVDVDNEIKTFHSLNSLEQAFALSIIQSSFMLIFMLCKELFVIILTESLLVPCVFAYSDQVILPQLILYHVVHSKRNQSK